MDMTGRLQSVAFLGAQGECCVIEYGGRNQRRLLRQHLVFRKRPDFNVQEEESRVSRSEWSILCIGFYLKETDG
ncbi:hypothetical protein GDO81_023408 [Engystomops pustulosus]|uniref:Uncharacterized protein n=1 Tax=Engystomops pustulosus TaxID=76066 RepID=A0AAV6YLF2_ENGPU|nr:hypothetical protein GDO81_023408 [Engystomops pustulosus]